MVGHLRLRSLAKAYCGAATGNELATDTETIIAENTTYHGVGSNLTYYCL